MKNISIWAKNHRNKARLSIIILKILLAVMASFIASALYKIKIILPEITGLTVVCLFVITAMIYPSRKTSISKKSFYIKQKSCDYILLAAGFLMTIFFVNNRFYTLTNPPAVFARHPLPSKPTLPLLKRFLNPWNIVIKNH